MLWLKIIAPHNIGISDDNVVIYKRANPNDGILNNGIGADHTAISNQAVAHSNTVETGARKIAGSREDRFIANHEVKWRIFPGKFNVGPVEGAYCTNVFPVAIKQVGLNVVIFDGLGKEFLAKIGCATRGK